MLKAIILILLLCGTIIITERPIGPPPTGLTIITVGPNGTVTRTTEKVEYVGYGYAITVTYVDILRTWRNGERLFY